MIKIKRALISVSDKTDVVDLAKALVKHEIEIISTGGTSKVLAENDIQHCLVEDYTEFPEMMDGRVKTLHPKIHGGILARPNVDDDVISKHQIKTIDLVVVNLYPFAKVTADDNCTLNHAIENIDIGGPTLIRATAKNYQHRVVVCDPNDYDLIIEQLNNKKSIDEQTRYMLAEKAFLHTARYDATIANYLQKVKNNHAPQTKIIVLDKVMNLRYGENQHQLANLYRSKEDHELTQLQGKTLSLNNITDCNSAYACVKSFGTKPTCAIVKHNNPCGVASRDTQNDAYLRAYATDSTSAFGGIIAFNQSLQGDTAQTIIDNQFVEIIIAPGFSPEALAILKAKPNVRLLLAPLMQTNKQQLISVDFGTLVQDADSVIENELNFKCVTENKPSEKILIDLSFAWKVAKYVKSNAIVYAKAEATCGIGAGQMSRIDSAKIGKDKAAEANLTLNDAVMASDAFFPFADNVELAAKLGINAIIQPGGSKRDDEVIAMANKHNIVMLFTAIRHFRH